MKSCTYRKAIVVSGCCLAMACFAADRLSPVRIADVRVAGHVADVQGAFFSNRICSDFARSEIWGEAHEAFRHPDDDVFQAPIGMWKGEYWGKLMISACRVAEYLHDEQLKSFLHDEALRLIAYQRPDGYLGTYVNPEFVVPTGEAPVKGGNACWNWNLWCRKYTLWGLLSCYSMTGDRKLLDAADRAMSQQISMLRRLGLRLADTGTSTMRGLPPCSILKPLVWLYRETGKPLYLDYANEIYALWSNPSCRAPQFAAMLSTGKPIQEWYPDENGKWGKAYEMMSCLEGIVELYRVTGDVGMLKVVREMRDRILLDEQNLCLSVGYNDQFWGAKRMLNGVSEPCDAIHWMRLNFELWLVTGEAAYIDAVEETFYNAFLAGVRPDGKWGARCVRSHGRHQPAPPQSGMKLQHCCVNNIPRGFMDAAQSIAATDAEGAISVALYHDSDLKFGTASIRIAGDFPISNRVRVSVSCGEGRKLRLRVPPWAACMTVSMGSAKIEADRRSRWVELSLSAGKSDIDIAFGMNPRIVRSDREPVPFYGNSQEDPRVGRWAGKGEPDILPLIRKTPAAQLMWGPLLLAKSIRIGDSEAEILDPTTVNGPGWTVKLDRSASRAGVWGMWTATFERGAERKSVGVCDYSSAAEWTNDKIEFSTFF